jgi:hypothetical protein
MTRTGMPLVKVAVQVAQGAMIGTVLGSAVEAFLMCASVGLVHFAVEPIVRRMIASVSIVGGV